MSSIRSNIDFSDLLPYCIFPNSFIRNGNISSQEKVLFEILCSYDFINSEGNRKGWCDPSLDVISGQMGLGVRAVQIHLKRLVQRGLVIVIYRNTNTQGARSSIYVLNILPGLSAPDRQRIASTRTIEIKHKISGLNTIKVQTITGMQYISEEEFDLEYLITGNRSSEIIEGEIIDANKLFEDDTTEQRNESNKSEDTEVEPSTNDFEVTFKKPDKPLSKPVKLNETYNDPDPVVRILSGNYTGLTSKDLTSYFKHKYELQYPGETLSIDYVKDARALKAKMVEQDFDTLVKLIDYFILSYQKLFYNEEYRRPRIYQLSVKWIFNKLLENFYYMEKGKEPIPDPIDATNIKRVIL